MYWGHSGVAVGSAQNMNSSCPASSQPKTLWTRFSLSYNWLGHLSLGACVTQILAAVWPPPLCALLPKLVYWLVRDVPVLGCVALGWGCFFLKATSYVCPVLLSPFCLPFCCSASPFFPTTPPSPNFGKHICNICVHCGMGPLFHLMLYL